MQNLQGLKSRSLIRLHDGFVSADSARVMRAVFVSVESKEVSISGLRNGGDAHRDYRKWDVEERVVHGSRHQFSGESLS